MTIVGILMGIAAVITGIYLAKRRGHKLWYVLTAVGACICGISLFFLICTLLLTSAIQQQPPAGQNSDSPNSGWRTEHNYSKDYTVGDGINVCFTWSPGAEEQEGWRVFDSNDGSVIQLLTPQGCPEQYFSNTYEALQAEDYDGDGKNELGIGAASGAVLWYKWNGNRFQYLWTETGVSASTESRPYEPCAEDGLTENQRTLYEEMQPKILAREPFSYDAATYGYDTLDDTFAAWAALSADNPEIDNYFMLKENIDENGRTLSLDSFYSCSWTEDENTDLSELTEGLAEFDRVCDDILAGMPENAPTYEKYRYLAQAVSERADYDYSLSLPAIATPYGLVTGDLICQGYSEAYMVLCQRAGLWCRMVSGSSLGDSHAWNLVWLESGTYHVDITWADEGGEPGGEGWMRYFMLSQDEITLDHTIMDGTEATGTPLAVPDLPEGQGDEGTISQDDAAALIQRAMKERGETASVIVSTGEETIGGAHCLTFSAGDDSADGKKYTAMYHYAVSDSGAVYFMDPLQGGDWILYRCPSGT